MKNLITYLVLFATIFLKIEAIKRCRITDGYEVHVINRLPNPKLRLHCASGDDDLGYHNTTTNYDYNFSFCESYLGKTLFFCHLYWSKYDAKFDVFTSSNSEKCRRGKCIWEARTDGIYFSGGQVPSEFQKLYNWNRTN